MDQMHELDVQFPWIVVSFYFAKPCAREHNGLDIDNPAHLSARRSRLHSSPWEIQRSPVWAAPPGGPGPAARRLYPAPE